MPENRKWSLSRNSLPSILGTIALFIAKLKDGNFEINFGSLDPQFNYIGH